MFETWETMYLPGTGGQRANSQLLPLGEQGHSPGL